jgi:hypothetical protein
MVSPLQRLLDAVEPAAVEFGADCPGVSQPPVRQIERSITKPPIAEHPIAEPRRDEAAGDDDLKRIERSLEWLKRERMVVALEAGLGAQNLRRRLPPAGQLPPLSGTPAANADGVGRRRAKLSLQVAPPRAYERLQPPAARSRYARNLPAALFILTASIVAGSIAYHVATGELLSALEPAQAAPLQAP